MNLKQFIEEGKKEFSGRFMNNGINGVIEDEFQDEKLLLIRDFYDSQQIKLVEMIIKKVNHTQVELCKEFSNTPINERKNGWDWIVRYRKELLESIK